MTASVSLGRVESKPKPVSGAGMDQPLPKRPQRYGVWIVVALVLSGAIAAIWQLLPRGLQVAAGDIRIATVQQRMFRNDIVVRSTAAPLHTVMLDAFESGRVEEILASDGVLVSKGDLLFRLSNPQLRLDLVAREADRAQQISNLSLLRVALEGAETEHQRRMLDLNVALAQTQRQHARYESLVEQGYVSKSMLEDSQGRLAQQRQAVDDEQKRAGIEMRIKRDGVRQMEQAIERLDAGLKVVTDSIDGLAVRAPIAGRLTDFRLQLGEIVKPEQRIGRIDDPSRFKLVAEIDEYFLGRVSVGKHGHVTASGRDYPVAITRVFPQIKEGRFSTELSFTDAAPAGLNPGQSLETRLTLGETSPALILPNDAFLNDSGGTWVFAVARDGKSAERRAIRVGRRNNSQVEVAAGLAPGERVIVSTYAAYGDAQRLQIGK
jgi:HlyD family secretion protein